MVVLYRGFARVVLVCASMCSAAVWGDGQQAQPTPLPAEPVATQAGKQQVEAAPVPIAGDAIFSPLATSGPQSFKLRFEDYVVITYGPRAIVSPAFSAALRMARPPDSYPREWRDGAEAFGRNYGDAITRKVAFQTARFGVGAALHEDFRYRRAVTSNGAERFLHAVGYTLVDQSDGGRRRLALANFSAAAAAGAVPTLYLPDGYNTAAHARNLALSRLGGIGLENVTREFAPEIFKIFHGSHLPFPRLPVPEWWTKDLRVARP